MRLFIAVDLPGREKDALDRFVRRLQVTGVRGSFTRRDNFHLTVAFLGETDRLSDIMTVMDRVDAHAFSLRSAEPGRFQGGRGDTWWLGLEPCPDLKQVQARLGEALEKTGFQLEERPFRPHVTLGRHVATGQGFCRDGQWGPPPVLAWRVEQITLMRSEQAGGALTYTPLYQRRLT